MPKDTSIKLPTTSAMVNEIFANSTAKGITLAGIYSSIRDKYSIQISNLRKTYIKSHILELRESEDLKNVTGKGFTGHLKLINKKKFLRKIKSDYSFAAGKKTDVTKTLNKKIKKKPTAKETDGDAAASVQNADSLNNSASSSGSSSSPSSPIQHPISPSVSTLIADANPVVAIEADLGQYGIVPSQQYDSIFGTPPQVSSDVHASTPFEISDTLPLALMRKRKMQEPPVLNKAKRKQKNVASESIHDTPRSSTSSKRSGRGRRKLN